MKDIESNQGGRLDDGTLPAAAPAEANDVVLMTEEEMAQLLGVEELPDVEMRNPRC